MASEPILVAEMSDVRPFARLLRGVGHRHKAMMTVSKAGFEFIVEDASITASAWVPTNLFSTFEYPDDAEAEAFEISLDALLQCLNIFGNAGGGAAPIGPGRRRRWAGEGEPGEDEWTPRGKEKRTGMRITWLGVGYPLSVLLREDAKGPVTTCELYTLELEEQRNPPFTTENRVVYMVMKSEWFRDALLDLPQSCTRVVLRCRPKDTEGRRKAKGNCTIFAEGDFGNVQFEYPNQREVMDSFDCEDEVSFSYDAGRIALLGRGLQHSAKVCVQIEWNGFLSVQVMMPVPESLPPGLHNGILEFKMHALTEDDSEGE